LIEKYIKQLNSRKLSLNQKKALIKKMEERGITGQIISLPRNDTSEALAVIEYFEHRRRLSLAPDGEFLKIPSAQRCFEMLEGGEHSLKSRKTALVSLVDSRSGKALKFLEKYRENVSGDLKIWADLAWDEMALLSKEKNGRLELRFRQIEVRRKGLKSFNDRLIRIAPYYFCDCFCAKCGRKKDCTFWLENLSLPPGRKAVPAPLPDRGAGSLFSGLIFSGEQRINQGVKKTEVKIQEATDALTDFAALFIEAFRAKFWLEAAFHEEMKNFLLFQAVFREKAGLAAAIFANRIKNEKDRDTASRLFYLACFSLEACQKLAGEMAKQAPEVCFAQYLELLKVTEKAQREIKRDLPRLEKYQKKVIINYQQ